MCLRFAVACAPKHSSPAERKELPFHLDRAADAVECLLSEGLEPAQNTDNG